MANKHRWLATYAKKHVINTNAAMHYRAAIQNTSESGRQLILAFLGVRLGFRQLAFSGDAFVRFIYTLDPVFILPGTLRQRLSDYINAAWSAAGDRRHELYKFADMKFVVRHGASTSRKGVSITLPAAVYQAIMAMGEEWKFALRVEAERREKRSVPVYNSPPPGGRSKAPNLASYRRTHSSMNRSLSVGKPCNTIGLLTCLRTTGSFR